MIMLVSYGIKDIRVKKKNVIQTIRLPRDSETCDNHPAALPPSLDSRAYLLVESSSLLPSVFPSLCVRNMIMNLVGDFFILSLHTCLSWKRCILLFNIAFH